ncbi:IS3 family transposase [Lysinibacillus sphaericus]|uniref:IS3 family transposase n=1 Tax=Lysinibacillus sphaericus TaxID=1421 RepID=UPI003D028A79
MIEYSPRIISKKNNRKTFYHFLINTTKTYLVHLKTSEEMIQAVEEYIYFYNYQRFQKRISHLTPIEHRRQMAA